MALLGRNDILECDDQKFEVVAVPEWGGEVRLRSLSAKERDAFEATMMGETKSGKPKQNLENFRARLVALCIVDEEGNRVFPQSDVQRLGSKSAAALQRVFDACNKLNAITEEDIEEMAEGFDNEPSED